MARLRNLKVGEIFLFEGIKRVVVLYDSEEDLITCINEKTSEIESWEGGSEYNRPPGHIRIKINANTE